MNGDPVNVDVVSVFKPVQMAPTTAKNLLLMLAEKGSTGAKICDLCGQTDFDN